MTRRVLFAGTLLLVTTTTAASGADSSALAAVSWRRRQRPRGRRHEGAAQIRSRQERTLEDAAAPRPFVALHLERPHLPDRLRKGSKNLETFCVDRSTGKILWRQSVTADQTDPLHELNSPASSTPATDGERIYVYFGQFGLLCLRSRRRRTVASTVPPIPGRFGSGQSPVVADGVVLLNTGTNNFTYTTTAFDAKTGKTLWEKGRSARLLARALVHTGDSKSRWRAMKCSLLGGADSLRVQPRRRRRALACRADCPCVSMNTPVLDDGVAIFTLSNPIGDRDNVVMLPSFEEALKKFDKNGDGKIQTGRDPRRSQCLYPRAR